MAAPQSLSALLIASFDRALHAVPQKGGMLKDTVRVETGIVGEDHAFPALGKAVARTRASLQPIQASPTVKARPKATLELLEHYEFLADDQVARTNVNAMAGYGRNSRLAIERGCDQWIIDAVKTINTQAIGSPLSSPTAAKVSKEFLTAQMTSFKSAGVAASQQITFSYNEKHFTNIAEINELLSRDYSERGFVESGTIPRLYGMQWRGIETREEGGWGDTESGMWAKDGIGLALGTIDRMSDVSWRNDLNAYQIGARLLGGSTAIDKQMVVSPTLVL